MKVWYPLDLQKHTTLSHDKPLKTNPNALQNVPSAFEIFLGRGFEDHMKNIEHVLSLFRYFKLKLKPSKRVLLRRDILFLGHKVNREGRVLIQKG